MLIKIWNKKRAYRPFFIVLPLTNISNKAAYILREDLQTANNEFLAFINRFHAESDSTLFVNF